MQSAVFTPGGRGSRRHGWVLNIRKPLLIVLRVVEWELPGMRILMALAMVVVPKKGSKTWLPYLVIPWWVVCSS
jgi:hypothetical protein